MQLMPSTPPGTSSFRPRHPGTSQIGDRSVRLNASTSASVRLDRLSMSSSTARLSRSRGSGRPWDDGHEGRHEFQGGHERFERRERFEHFRQPFITFGFYPYPYPDYAYA